MTKSDYIDDIDSFDWDSWLNEYESKVASEYKPFFVYGTLMSGFGNHACFGNAVENIVPAMTKGRMYPVSSKYSFPCVLEGEGIIHGELIYVDKEWYSYILDQVDNLEGYNEFRPESSLYIRKEVVCTTADGESVNAWCYISTLEFNEKDRIVHGDWRKAKQERIVEKLNKLL